MSGLLECATERVFVEKPRRDRVRATLERSFPNQETKEPSPLIYSSMKTNAHRFCRRVQVKDIITARERRVLRQRMGRLCFFFSL